MVYTPELEPYVDPYADVPPPESTEDEGRPPRPHLRERVMKLSDLAKMPGVEPLVDGLLYRDTLAQLSGPPGSYKSFVTLGISCAVALGQNWEGHHVPKAGRVVYVAAEGASGLLARILAWCELTSVDPAELEDRLFILPAPIQLGNIVDVSEAVELVSELDAALLVLDTRARCTIGLEENSATEQGRAIDQLEKIQRAAKCTVLVVHHSPKNGAGGRGSSAWDGQVWSDLRVTGEDLYVTLEVAKHKDAISGTKHQYRLVKHTVTESWMPNATEDQRKSLVVVRRDPSDNLSEDRPSTRAVLDILRTSAGQEGLSRAEIRDLAQEHGVSKSMAYEAVNALLKKGALRNVGTEKRAKYVPVAAYLEGM
jgi:RecA-family ATPase